MKFTKAIRALGTEELRRVLKDEIAQLDVGELPLQRALRSGSYLCDEKPTVMINGIEDHGDRIVARVGVFFTGVDAGSCCANDPTAVEPQEEYCVLRFDIERESGEAMVSLDES